jgi:hypothetical protein
MPWQPPSLTVKWGPYRKPDPEEQLQAVQAVEAAMGAPTKLLTVRIALEKLRDAGFINADNLEAVIDELKKEQAEADAKANADADRQLDDAIAIADATAKAKARTAGGGAPPKGPPK